MWSGAKPTIDSFTHIVVRLDVRFYVLANAIEVNRQGFDIFQGPTYCQITRLILVATTIVSVQLNWS